MNKHLRIHSDGGKIYQCTMCELSFYYREELEEHKFEHYKKDKTNEKEKMEKTNDHISNNTLSPVVILKPTFVHDNVQIWE